MHSPVRSLIKKSSHAIDTLSPLITAAALAVVAAGIVLVPATRNSAAATVLLAACGVALIALAITVQPQLPGVSPAAFVDNATADATASDYHAAPIDRTADEHDVFAAETFHEAA